MSDANVSRFSLDNAIYLKRAMAELNGSESDDDSGNRMKREVMIETMKENLESEANEQN